MTAPTALERDPRIPNLAGFQDHFGIPVCSIGEDGAYLVALGHHPHKAALAAFNQYVKALDWPDLLDSGRWDAEGWREALKRVKHAWAVRFNGCCHFTEEPAVYVPCARCRDAEWWLNLDAAEDDPGAFPITYWTC